MPNHRVPGSGWEPILDTTDWRADPAYISTSAVTPRKKPFHGKHDDNTRATNRYISPIRSAVEKYIAHWKNWKILATGYRRLLTELPEIIRAITRLELYLLGW
ncbi:transposase family protein [Rathayibacter toxicus]|uniref:transposase family protein n=1 Tax=Rathayibacter toxicus TaxID=145458 RepID=UPI001C055559|nr:transposase family protein [Rathayibacter toxicus]